MNKTIYINNSNRDKIIEASKTENINSIVNKALNLYFGIGENKPAQGKETTTKGKTTKTEKKPVKQAETSKKSWAELLQEKRKKKATE